jgi:hypothetical protein
MTINRTVIILLVIIAVLFGIILILSLSRAASPPESPTSAVTFVPTIWITPVVTQIVATLPTSTATQIPTSTPYPTATLVWDPFSVPFYYPLADCGASRLKKGEMAFVGFLDRTLRISLSNQVFADPGIRDLGMGELLYITSDPICERNTVIWGVRAISDDTVGFEPEGDGTTYWLFPASPAIPTPRKLK